MNRIATIITIDGPAGSGKTSVAELLATELDWVFLNTGAMYRAATIAVIDAGVRMDPLDVPAAIAAVRASGLHLDDRGVVHLRSGDITARLSSDEVSKHVSAVSQIPEVRELLTPMQREFGVRARPGVVAEGRDMASVVFPDAKHRFYLDAKLEERARRHLHRMTKKGMAPPTLDDAIRDIDVRDHKDSTRAVAPLKRAAGVCELDTTTWTLERTVREILDLVRVEGTP
ncbi:MAG: (d)CMP kinase [Planctomycetes bacterium]|nr:(d)CMP kinase [Planctomycetota bacterium]MCC7172846.1 (d)CMP kinase [Planctomycetota bacterium]